MHDDVCGAGRVFRRRDNLSRTIDLYDHSIWRHFWILLAEGAPHSFGNVSLNRTLFTESSLSFSSIFASLVMPALYYITDQEFAKPLFNIKNKATAAASAVRASMFMLIFSLVPIYFGIKAKTLNLTIAEGVSPLIPVSKILTNDIVVILSAGNGRRSDCHDRLLFMVNQSQHYV